MAQNALIQVRIEDELKHAADELFSDLGLDTPTAIRIFLKHAVNRQGLPFEVERNLPNFETITAIEESERIIRSPNAKRYSNFSELLTEVKNEI